MAISGEKGEISISGSLQRLIFVIILPCMTAKLRPMEKEYFIITGEMYYGKRFLYRFGHAPG